MHVFRSTRLTRRGDAFDHRLDAVVAPVLQREGFSEVEPYCWRRNLGSGQDVVYVNVTPAFFFVHVAHRPKYILEIDELYDFPDAEPVFGYAHLLTPKGVFGRTSGTFKCSRAADRDRSLAAAADALTAFAFPWLEAMCDPSAFADAVSPAAVMYKARAAEVSGDIARARAGYGEMMRRIREVRAACRSRRLFLESEAVRPFIYLCLKLQEDLALCSEVQELVGYRPRIVPLGQG
ncbi:MAG: hypothetical protein HY825_01490 [Acidobacteria bacterium]|nr:hypothetical protein [Acidobacteriota bacterium]